MAVSVKVRDPTLAQGVEEPITNTGPRYWDAKNHDTQNYLRVDKWLADVEEFMFTPEKRPIEVELSLEETKALRAFREDVKFFAALEDEVRKKGGVSPLDIKPEEMAARKPSPSQPNSWSSWFSSLFKSKKRAPVRDLTSTVPVESEKEKVKEKGTDGEAAVANASNGDREGSNCDAQSTETSAILNEVLQGLDPVSAMEDSFWLTKCFAKVRSEVWPSIKKDEELGCLKSVEDKLQAAIEKLGVGSKVQAEDAEEQGDAKQNEDAERSGSAAKGGAFVKLSVRSPKDSALCSPRLYELIRERFADVKSKQAANTAASEAKEIMAPASGQGDESRAKSDGVADYSSYIDTAAVVRWASWKSLKVTSGAEGLDVLLRSDRVYIDLLQHDLFSKDNGGFGISVHVAEFFSDFDPNWEFRAFVANGKKTALTMYSPFAFVPEIARNKEKILAVIQKLWDRVMPKIKSQNYCVDFAVSPDLENIWVVEVNDFLPPLAGAGLFVFSDALDKRTLLDGPFEFRVMEEPLDEEAAFRRRVDEHTTMHYAAAAPHVLEFAQRCAKL